MAFEPDTPLRLDPAAAQAYVQQNEFLSDRRAVTGRTKDDPQTPESGPSPVQVEAVMDAARRAGLLGERSGRIGGRVSPALVRQAKARTGLSGDSELIAFALASLALDDRFAEVFRSVRGQVDPDLDLGL